MSKPSAPDRIWLQPATEDYRDGWTWCWHAIDEGDDPDIEYIRAEAAAEMLRRPLDDAERSAATEILRVYREQRDPFALDKAIGAVMSDRASRYLRGEAP